jgi:hypothetical protein
MVVEATLPDLDEVLQKRFYDLSHREVGWEQFHPSWFPDGIFVAQKGQYILMNCGTENQASEVFEKSIRQILVRKQ